MRDAIGRLYCELLRLCACISKYESSRIRYILNPLGKEFGTVATAIDQRALEIDRAAQAAHFQESKVAREILLAETQGTIVYCSALRRRYSCSFFVQNRMRGGYIAGWPRHVSKMIYNVVFPSTFKDLEIGFSSQTILNGGMPHLWTATSCPQTKAYSRS